MMRIINKIYIWFKKVILNILGVIRDMINKDNEVKILAMETIRDGIKNIFISRLCTCKIKKLFPISVHT